MKSKLSWITFVPLLLAAGFFRAAQWIFPEGGIFNLSSLMLNYFYIGAVVLTFLFTCLFCTIDRKISLYYIPHRNIPAGLLGILAALAFATDGAVALFNVFGSGKVEVLPLIEYILMLLSAIVFIVLGLTHSFKGESKGLSLINVLPALLFAVRMIVSFVSFTTTSLKLADVAELVCYVFATLFFFNYAVALSLVKAKHAVKSCMIFGFPAVAALLPYGVVKLVFSFNTQDLFANLGAVEAVLIGLYIISFLIELTAFVKDRDSVTVIEDDDEDEEEFVESDADADGYVVASGIEDDERESSYLKTADTSDFLYQEVKNEEQPSPVSENAERDMDSYITHLVADDDKSSDRPKDYESRLDEIDKLILEITEQSD